MILKQVHSLYMLLSELSNFNTSSVGVA